MKCQRLFAAALAVLVALTAGLHAEDKNDTKPTEATGKPKTASYMHVVVFTMKKDAPKDAISAAIADCNELLTGIPSVRVVRVGRPAEKATPDLAKKNYDFALLVLLDDFDGLKIYLEHPQHLKFVEKHGMHFDMEKIQVFDFTNDKK